MRFSKKQTNSDFVSSLVGLINCWYRWYRNLRKEVGGASYIQGHPGRSQTMTIEMNCNAKPTLVRLCFTVLGGPESRGVLRKISEMLEVILKRMDSLSKLGNTTDTHRLEELSSALDRYGVALADGTNVWSCRWLMWERDSESHVHTSSGIFFLLFLKTVTRLLRTRGQKGERLHQAVPFIYICYTLQADDITSEQRMSRKGP